MTAVIVVSDGKNRLVYTGRRDAFDLPVLVDEGDPHALRYVNEWCARGDWLRLRAELPAPLVVAIEEDS